MEAGQAPDQRERRPLGRLRLTLPQLNARLQNEGFVVGPDRWLNVYDLLLKLHEQGRLPERTAALRPLLAPLFCRDAAEQARFARVFQRWLEEQPDAGSKLEGIPSEPPPEPPPRAPLRCLMLWMVLIGLVLPAAVYVGYRHIPAPVPSVPTEDIRPSRPDGPPIPDDGTVIRSTEPLEPRALPPRAPLEQPRLSDTNRDVLQTAGLLVALLPAFLLAGLLGARWLSWDMVLRRRAGRDEVPMHAITLDAGQDDLFDAPELREALKRLHTPVAVPTRRLHADATVHATTRAAGLFCPVLRERRVVPDCVVLLDHAHGADQMAAVGLQAIDRLREAGLEVVRYDYRRDPRRLMGEDRRWHRLDQVAARHERSRLLVIGEAASLVNPLSGALYGWTDVIELWPGRGLLSTRRPPESWRAALAARGFLVADLSSTGLAQLAAWFSPVQVETAVVPARRLRLLPRLLQDDEYWLQPVAPPRDELEDLLETLRAYLGPDGLLLFAAMAAYPQLHWGLIRALDLGLFPDSTAEAREQRLLSVARLPWCRAGGLPDWLREALKADLDAEQDERIARLYQWLLNEAEVNGRGRIKLPITFPEGGTFWRRLRHWFKARGQIAGRYDPRNDRIFIEILLGWRARVLDFRLPRTLARRLGPWLNALLPRLVLAVPIALAAGWVAHASWDRWGHEPAQDWLLTHQLSSNEAITVHIWHTEATGDYALALAQTLRMARFKVLIEPLELTMVSEPLIEQLEYPDWSVRAAAANALGQIGAVESTPALIARLDDADASVRAAAQEAIDQIRGISTTTVPTQKEENLATQVHSVNFVQWGTDIDPAAVQQVVDRLAYLSWGSVPNQVAPGSELPLTGPGLDTGPEPGQVRVLLLTPARNRTGFAFRDPLTEAGRTVPEQLFRDALRDGGQDPDMIALPGGRFLMGSPDDEPERYSDEGPQREVRVPPFAIGRTEVTFADYDRFAEATGREPPNDAGWGRGDRPVINVSWNDAMAYADWLSRRTGLSYRLPSEAEWEYAARAGTTTPFWTGDCIHTDQANYDGNYDYNDCGANTGVYRQQTVEAGSLPANAWGLHETAGNVYEWVQDCWHDDYQGAPVDGSAWEEPGCAQRVVRGGGWFNRPVYVRSADRGRNAPGGADNDLGFRLARDL